METASRDCYPVHIPSVTPASVNKIECPECREKHEAKKEEKSFPQNKYILTRIKTKPSKQPTTIEFEKCEEHGKELSLYCKEPDCGKIICRLCLGKHHKRHNVIAIEEQRKDVLMRDLARIDLNLETKVKIMSQAKKNMEERTKSVIEEIKKKKEEFDRHYEMIIEKGEGLSRIQNLLIDYKVSEMNSNLEVLRSLKQDIWNKEEISQEDIMNSQEAVRGIIENINEKLSGERCFDYPVITMGGSSVEEFLGEVTRHEITVSMPKLQKQIEGQLIPRTINDADELICTGIFKFLPRKKSALHKAVFDRKNFQNFENNSIADH